MPEFDVETFVARLDRMGLKLTSIPLADGKLRVNRWRMLKQIPASTPESTALSRDLLRRGFTFVGPTICYAFMQAVGMVNDHTVDCFRAEPHKPARRVSASPK